MQRETTESLLMIKAPHTNSSLGGGSVRSFNKNIQKSLMNSNSS